MPHFESGNAKDAIKNRSAILKFRVHRNFFRLFTCEWLMTTGNFHIDIWFLSFFIPSIKMGLKSYIHFVQNKHVSQVEDKIRLFANLCRFFGYLFNFFRSKMDSHWITRYLKNSMRAFVCEYSSIMAKIRVT